MQKFRERKCGKNYIIWSEVWNLSNCVYLENKLTQFRFKLTHGLIQSNYLLFKRKLVYVLFVKKHDYDNFLSRVIG